MENKKNGFLKKKRSRPFSNENRGKGNFNKFNNKNKENAGEDKSNNFNKGEYKKKYDKKYIFSKITPNQKFKTKLNNKENTKYKKTVDTITHNNLNLTLTENLFKKAKEIYEKKVSRYII